MIQVLPIEERHLAEVCRFLNANLNRDISPEAWAASLTHRWAESQPNFGVQLRDDEKLVGVLGAIYSDQLVDGRMEKFCNPHSWCVLDDYRNSGISLVLQLLKQRGYHFTMFTANARVTEIFLGLRFRRLDDRMSFAPNLPAPWSRGGDRFLESNPERIAACLDGPLLKDFDAHRDISWLNFAAFGQEGDVCLVVYKRRRWRRLPCAWILHVSDTGAMARHGDLLRHHLLVDRGLLVSGIEDRFLEINPRFAYRTRRRRPKLVFSRTLPDSQVRDLYSELVALDL